MSWIGSQKDLLEWAGPSFNCPFSAGDFREHLKAQPKDSFYPLCLIDEEADVLVAYGEVNVVKADDPITAELSRIIVDPTNSRGKGIGSAFVSLTLKFCFEDLDLTRVGLNVYAHNASAVRCYQKAGFVEEGLRRRVARCDGVYWDSYVMSVLRDDFGRPFSN